MSGLFWPTGTLAQEREVVLENENLRVRLRKDLPSVIDYHLKGLNAVLPGDVAGHGPGISFYKGGDQVVSNWTKVSWEVSSATPSQVTYHGTAVYGTDAAVEFDIMYSIDAYSLNVKYTNVVEHPDFYLISIMMPGLISAGPGESARLVIPADAGRLISVSRATPHDLEYEVDWLHPVLNGMAYDERVIGILDTESIENHTVASVFEYRGQKYGSFAMKFMHRLMEYDLHEFGPVVPVTDPKKLLKVQDASSLTITIQGDYDHDGNVSWVDGAKVLRDGISAVPNPYYQGKSFVRTFVDRPPTRRDTTGLREELKFEEVLQRIRELAAQTDSAAYVMYLLGWQYEGHDSGYPSVDKVNENLGGFDALVRLIREAKKFNVNVTFYDNYDDSYPDHPGWDPDVICVDPQGQLIKGGVWEGSQSYLISSYKYAMKSALDRVRFTLSTYPVEGAYFVDVLSGGFNGGRKYDFNPESPAGAMKNFEGKRMIIEEFNKKGIDIATEDFTGYFVGHVGTFGNIIAFDNAYFENEEAIPLIPFIYHSKTSYGMKISDRSKNLSRLVYGQRAEDFTNKRSVFTAADYILDNLPKQKLYGKAMKSYEKEGTLERVVYEDGSVVEADVVADTYSVALPDGLVIARNYSSFVPVKEYAIMACSRDGGHMAYSLPSDWHDGKNIHVWKLNADGTRENVKCKVAKGKLSFHAEPNAPYKVQYSHGEI